ncbi:MAG: hypothetical protein EOP88_19075 [Verrucomicrobiaceae bacterium]|nr:MAG: hypothetical protein EOP88_19075 [Verrucomicrobiaceae bacterium]
MMLALLLGCADAAGKKERWIYIPANFQVDAEADRVIALLERSDKVGFTHALLHDSKFSRLGTVTAAYRPNTDKVSATAKRLGIELVPAVFPVGYSNDLLFHDPNLAEGLPVKNALFEVKDGVAKIIADPPVTLPGTTSRAGWDFVDDAIVPDDGGLFSKEQKENARLCRKLKVSPFRQYHLSVRIRTAALAGGQPEIKVLGTGGKSLQWTSLGVKPDQPWTVHDVTFNSLDSAEINIYFGVWGGHGGAIWWKDTAIEECGPVNLLRRKGTPLTVKTEAGRQLAEGTDFERVTNPHTGTDPWPGAYKPWHEPWHEPQFLRMKSFADGEKLRVSYFHTHLIHDGQVCGCVGEPAFKELLANQADEVVSWWGARTHFMSHDEWRVLGWDDACRAEGRTPGQLAEENLRFCTGVLRQKVPGGRILVWNDMFDPFHNAVKDYYLVSGSLEKSWEGLSPDVEVMNWNFGKRDESLSFFAERGHRQVIAGYYDSDLADVDAWLASAAKVEGVRGFMYTTWRQDYSRLEDVAAKLDRAGW